MSKLTPAYGFNHTVGYEVQRMENGEAELHLNVADKHLNSGGIVHGGVLATLLDSASGASAFSVLPKERFAPTTNMTVSYMSSVSSGTLVATAKVLKQGSKMISTESEVHCDDVLLAKALVSMMVVERRQPMKFADEGSGEDSADDNSPSAKH